MKQADKILSEILGFYKYKVDNNLCSVQEIQDAIKALESNMDISASIPDLAKFFDKSEGNIRATISRKLISKPKRQVSYPFHKFLEIVPDNWLHNK